MIHPIEFTVYKSTDDWRYYVKWHDIKTRKLIEDMKWPLYEYGEDGYVWQW